MRRLKHWWDARRAKKIMKEIIAKEGPPESDDEAAEISKRAWEQLGYKVVDARDEFEERGEE